jgi:hypothetical protein
MVKKHYDAELILSNTEIKKFNNLDINDLRFALENEIFINYNLKIPLSNDTIYNVIKRPQKTNIFIRQKIKIQIVNDSDAEDSN